MKHLRTLKNGFSRHKSRLSTMLLTLAMLIVSVAPAFAQTPVPLEIPVDTLISNVNTWVVQLAPVIFFGTAIGIAIALLTFIGNVILKAFRGSGAR